MLIKNTDLLVLLFAVSSYGWRLHLSNLYLIQFQLSRAFPLPGPGFEWKRIRTDDIRHWQRWRSGKADKSNAWDRKRLGKRGIWYKSSYFFYFHLKPLFEHTHIRARVVFMHTCHPPNHWIHLLFMYSKCIRSLFFLLLFDGHCHSTRVWNGGNENKRFDLWGYYCYVTME